MKRGDRVFEQRRAAIQGAVAHLGGHTQEIIYITRLRLGDRYGFFWKPMTKEQGA